MSKEYFGGKSPKKITTTFPFMEEYLTAKEREGIKTLSVLRLAIAHFADFAHSQGVHHPDEITRKLLIRYQTHLKTAKTWRGVTMSESYQTRLLVNLRGWLRWLTMNRYLEENPWVDIKVSFPTPKVTTLGLEEIEILFEAHRRQAFTLSPFYYHRREVILVMLYGWGLLINEALNLTVASVDQRLEWVTVHQTSGAVKHLPYSTEMKAVMQRWLRVRAARAKVGGDALLIDRDGKRMSEAMVRKILTELGEQVGIRASSRRLRGAFAETMFRNEVDLADVMAMMGHSDRDTTRKFKTSGKPEVKDAFEQTMSPVISGLVEEKRNDQEQGK